MAEKLLYTYKRLQAGAKKSSPYSSALFNLYTNKLLINTRKLGQRCYVNQQWVGCVPYEDNASKLYLSNTGFQSLLDIMQAGHY
jgi:hypothetical protein